MVSKILLRKQHAISETTLPGFRALFKYDMIGYDIEVALEHNISSFHKRLLCCAALWVTYRYSKFMRLVNTVSGRTSIAFESKYLRRYIMP